MDGVLRDRIRLLVKPTDEGGKYTEVRNIFTNACRECYEKVLAQIRAAKDAILAESREMLGVQEQVLKLALFTAVKRQLKHLKTMKCYIVKMPSMRLHLLMIFLKTGHLYVSFLNPMLLIL